MTMPAMAALARARSGWAGLWRALLAACMLALAAPHATAQPFNTRFVAIAFHGVVDRASELDDDAVTVDRLVALLDWLRGNGWQAISLDDVARAHSGERPLPAKAVLLTFDDGYRNLYTRVYPLLLAYRVPALAALVTEWLDVPPGGVVRYGEREVARERFIDWAQAREMQRSGWVEFALHTHALHGEVVGNPQGNTMPAAVTRRWSAEAGYESALAFTQRLRADLARGRALMQRELGRAPRALAWPYGRYNATAVREAQAAGFTQLLTLDPGLADARTPLAINRYLPTHTPPLSELVTNLRPETAEVRIARLACLDPAALASGNATEDDARLGRVIERARALGLTGVVVDALQRDAQQRVVGAWFPTRELPLAGDVLSRIAWQLQTRAGVAVHVRLAPRDVAAVLGGDAARVERLYDDLGAQVPLSGWLMEDGTPPASDLPLGAIAPDARTDAAWVVAEHRRAHLAALPRMPDRDAPAWHALTRLEAARPGLQLLWLAPASRDAAPAPHRLADFTLVPQSVDAAGVPGVIDARLLRWFNAAAPPDAARLAAVARDGQRRGTVAFGWCPDDPLADRPAAAAVASDVSARTFPARR